MHATCASQREATVRHIKTSKAYLEQWSLHVPAWHTQTASKEPPYQRWINIIACQKFNLNLKEAARDSDPADTRNVWSSYEIVWHFAEPFPAEASIHSASIKVDAWNHLLESASGEICNGALKDSLFTQLFMVNQSAANFHSLWHCRLLAVALSRYCGVGHGVGCDSLSLGTPQLHLAQLCMK